MVKTKLNHITMKNASTLGMRIAEIVVKIAAFVAFYFVLSSALPNSAPLFTAVIIGLLVSVAYTVFGKIKFVKLGTLGVVAAASVTLGAVMILRKKKD